MVCDKDKAEEHRCNLIISILNQFGFLKKD